MQLNLISDVYLFTRQVFMILYLINYLYNMQGGNGKVKVPTFIVPATQKVCALKYYM